MVEKVHFLVVLVLYIFDTIFNTHGSYKKDEYIHLLDPTIFRLGIAHQYQYWVTNPLGF